LFYCAVIPCGLLAALHVFTPMLGGYLAFCGVMFGVKNLLQWRATWSFVRKLFDLKYRGPALSAALSGQPAEGSIRPMMEALPKAMPPAEKATVFRRGLPPEYAAMLSKPEPPETAGAVA
jgi:hypothetical protein